MLARIFACSALGLWVGLGSPAFAQDNFWQSAPAEKPGKAERKKTAPAPAKKAPAVPAAKPADSGEAQAQASRPPAQQPAAAPPADASPKAAKAAPPVTAPAPPEVSASALAEQETAFWNSIKDSTNPDEFSAYLRKFPKGTFAELAQIKIRQLRQAAKGGTAGAASPPAQAPNVTFSAAMKEAQERLYGLNYDIGRFDGVPDERTERAIRAWQQRAGFPSTGIITLPQLARLHQIPQVKIWGAVAFAGFSGAAVVVTGQPSRARAEGKALADCLVRAKRACKAFAVPESRCGALAYFRQRLTNGNFTVTHAVGQDVTIPGATARALATCNKSEGTAGRCGILAATCANGHSQVHAPAFSDAPVPPPAGGAPGAQPRSVTPMPQPQPLPSRPMRRPGEQDT